MKRTPKVIPFDLNDPLHVELVQAASNIFAVIFNLPMVHDLELIKSIAKNVDPIKFAPKKIKIAVDEKEKENEPVEINEEDEV